MEANYLHLPHFLARQGANEHRTESYIRCGEGAAVLATKPCTKSDSGFAGKQAGTLRLV